MPEKAFSVCIKDSVFIDPCCGSGHILVYAFDVLMQIYLSAGWSERDAAKSILENNLYGLDIDDRAGQLAYFAVMMKARKHNRRVLNGDVKTNVISLQESNWMTDDFISYVAGKDAMMKADLIMLRKTFSDAKEFGSILNVPVMRYDEAYERIDIIGRSYAEDLFQVQHQKLAVERLLPLIRQSRIMSQKYEVAITNPPYMSSSGMSGKLGAYVKDSYPDSKSDLFAVFIERCGEMIRSCGYQAMITQHAWMFLSSFEKLRKKLHKRTVINMAHLGARAFEEIGGEVVQTTSFVILNATIHGYNAVYSRLLDETSQRSKEEKFLSGKSRYCSNELGLSQIPGMPYAYWVTSEVQSAFGANGALGAHADVGIGMRTGDNDRFMRQWSEVDFSKLGRNYDSSLSFDCAGMKWAPYNKGGSYRKWYGNVFYVVNWFNNGYEIKENTKKVYPQLGDDLGWKISNEKYYFRSGFTWSTLTTGDISVRFSPSGFIFDCKGSMGFTKEENDLFYIMGFINSSPCMKFLELLAPTLDINIGAVKLLPYKLQHKDVVVELVKHNIELSKEDWDSFETSWDFKKHPLV